MADKQVKVRVIDRWRVVHPDEGTAHVKDDVLVVPENVAQCARSLPESNPAGNINYRNITHLAGADFNAHFRLPP